jgi:DNA polymerase elongation subunit (family B)
MRCCRCNSSPAAAATRRYRLLEIELDAVYRSMLLLKKKKYAAVKVRQGQ